MPVEPGAPPWLLRKKRPLQAIEWTTRHSSNSSWGSLRMMRMMILRPRQPTPWRLCGRTKSTSKVQYLPLKTRILWSPTRRMRTTRCVRAAVSLPQTHWWFRTQEPCRSGLRVRECSLARIVQSASERTFWPPEPNTFSMRRPVDAELHGLPRGSPAINASKQKMSQETVTRRDVKIRDMAKGFTVNLAAI